MTTTGAPTARESHTAVWTGKAMVVWGGFGAAGGRFDGGIYDPATNSWSSTPTANAPTGRYLHVAVWTGTRMIVWGGQAVSGIQNTGGRLE